MNRQEAEAYYAGIVDQMTELSPEEKAVAKKVFSTERIQQAAIPTPEFSRGLDAERNRAKAAEERNNYLEKEWYPSAKAQHDAAMTENNRNRQLLSRYSQQFGAIEGAQDVADAARQTGLSEEKILESIKADMTGAFAARDRATLDLMEIREDYRDNFKKRMPLGEFENYVAEARKKGNQDGLQSLYKDWIAPELSKSSEAQIEARIKKAQDEAIRDYASRNNLPVDSRPKEVSFLNHAIREQKQAAGKVEKSGREAFLEGWDEAINKTG